MASITHFLKTGLARTAIFGGVLCAALSTLASAAAAQGRIEGSCEGYFDSPDATGFLRADGRVIRNEPIPALRDRVEVRAAPDQNASVVERLAFQERVFITAYENGFYAVNRDTREESLPDFGWVAGRDLLCSSLPLVNEDGISRKFIVRTQATYAGENDGALTAKTGPQSDACVETNGSCRKLTRFNIFYVYAIDEESQRSVLGLSAPVRVRSMITQDWRITVYDDDELAEMYDLKNDPYELRNLWNDPDYRDQRAELTERMLRRSINLLDRSPLPLARA